MCGLRFSFEQSSQPCVFGYMRACLPLRFTAYDRFFAFLVKRSIFALSSVSGCAGNLPPFLDVSTPAVAVRDLPRVSAQLSTSARASGSLVRHGVGIARAGQFRWVGSLGAEVAGPWPSRGSVEGPYPRQSGLSTLRCGAAKFYPSKRNENLHERVLGSALTWVEGAFG